MHFNAAQEAAQAEGDLDFNNVLKNISTLSRVVPVVAKEVGNGISREAAIELKDAGASALDTGGLGGTSWVRVDSLRAKQGSVFEDWGIPTTASIMECAPVLPVIGTGGIRNGLDAAKAIALGAGIVGVALPALKWYSKGGTKELEKGFTKMIGELRTAMFLTGSRGVGQLQSTNLIVSGGLRNWADARDISIVHYGCRSLPQTVIG